MVDKQQISSFLQGQDSFPGLVLLGEAAARFGCTLRDIEKIALRHSLMPRRLKRNGLSCSEQLSLLKATVAIIGCGGLGGRSAELLARIGIGHLILCDPDVFSESNLNRQIFCDSTTLGDKKVAVVGRALEQINPSLKTTLTCHRFSPVSLQGADIVIDALDSIQARKDLAGLCSIRDIPLVHGAVRGWYGQVGVAPSQGKLTADLFRHGKDPKTPPRVLPMTVSLVAAIQVAETCKLILKKDSPLTAGWLQCDLVDHDYDTVSPAREDEELLHGTRHWSYSI